MILHVLIAMVAGWLQRHQQQAITYLLAENRVLKAHLGGRRLRLTDTERRRLAAAIFDLKEEADLLRDCDRRADEHFRILDVMEEKDAHAGSR